MRVPHPAVLKGADFDLAAGVKEAKHNALRRVH
jgi:hypothetical protein